MNFEELIEQYCLVRYNKDNKTIDIINQMKTVALESDNKRMMGQFYFYYADWLFDRDLLLESHKKCMEALEYLVVSPYCDEIIYTYNLLGVISDTRGDKLLAVDYYMNGINYGAKLEASEAISVIYNNVGLLYQAIGNYEQGASYLQKAFENFKALGNRSVRTYVACMNLAILDVKRGRLEEASFYLEESIKYNYEEFGNRFDINRKVAYALFYAAKGLEKEGEEAFDEVIELIEAGQFRVSIFEQMIELLTIKVKIEDREKLRYVLSSMDDIAGQYNNTDYALAICTLWCKYFERFEEKELYYKATEEYFRLSEKKSIEVNKLLVEAADVKINLSNLEKKHRRTARKAEELQKKVLHDSLTKLYNRSALPQIFESRFEYAKHSGNNIGIAIIDVDYFKQYNDTYGHQMGDKCLEHISKLMGKLSDENVLFMRYGGDEFLAMFCDMEYEHVEGLLNLLKSEIEKLYILHAGSPDDKKTVTLTQGAYYGSPKEGDSLHDYIQLADAALYMGKKKRNTIVLDVEQIS